MSVESSTLENNAVMGVLFPGHVAASALPAEDLKKAQWVWELFQAARKWKSQTPYADAELNWDFWEGKHWQRPRAAGFAMAVLNMVYETVETFNGHIMDATQDRVVRSRRPDQQAAGHMLTKLVGWVDDINAMRARIDLLGRSAQCSGFGVLRVDWDERMDGWRGAPRLSLVDEEHFFAAPWTRELQDAEYVIEGRNVPISSVRRVWKRAALVPLGTQDPTLTPLRMLLARGEGPADYQAFTYGNSTQISYGGPQGESRRDLVTLLDAWIRQDDARLRRIVVCNGVVLEDGLSPYRDDRYPYIVANVIRDKNALYGWPLVSQIRKLNQILNEMTSYELDDQKYQSDSPLVISAVNTKDGKTFDNRPGGVYVDADPNGRGYYLLTKPGANPRYADITQRLMDVIQKISGGVDVLHGEHPAGVTTLGAMEIIRDSANVLVAKMQTHINEALREKDLLVVSRLSQFLKDERWVRITGRGNREEHLRVNERVGETLGGEQVLQNAIPDDFEADVDFTPAPPGGMQARLERDLALLQQGVVDRDFVLEDLEFDQAQVEAMNGRMEEQAAAEAKAQAAAAGGAASAQVPQDEPADPQALAQQAMALFS